MPSQISSTSSTQPQSQGAYFDEILHNAEPVFNRLCGAARTDVVEYLDAANRRLAQSVKPQRQGIYAVNEPILHRARIDIENGRDAAAKHDLIVAAAQYDAEVPLLSKGIRGQVGDFSLRV